MADRIIVPFKSLDKGMNLSQCVARVNQWYVKQCKANKEQPSAGGFKGAMDVALTKVDGRGSLLHCVDIWKRKYAKDLTKSAPTKVRTKRKRRRKTA